MSVYFIRAGEDGCVKIGFARNASARLRSLQTASHQTLAMIRVVDGDRRVERHFHTLFVAQRVRGEWFRFSPDMLTIEAPTSVTSHSPANRKLLPRPKNLYVWRRSEIGSFRAPLEPRVDYLDRIPVLRQEALDLKQAFEAIEAQDPERWPRWWLDRQRDRGISDEELSEFYQFSRSVEPRRSAA